MPGPMPYERFEAWKVSHELALAVYAATRGWPRSELYGLTSQVRRAALSAPTNIAEGSAKRGPAEFRRFLDYSLGSLSELAYLLRFARDGRFLTEMLGQSCNRCVIRPRSSPGAWPALWPPPSSTPPFPPGTAHPPAQPPPPRSP